MITTLREGKAKLSALVELAASGEEVIITVRGKPKARLGPVAPPAAGVDAGWLRELKQTRARYTVRRRDAAREILPELREDRL